MAEKEPKSRRGRYAYLDDYQKNDKGEYEYKGDRYRWIADEDTLKKLRIWLRIISAAAFALEIAAGCIPAPGVGYTVYIILPYVISIAGSFSVCMAAWRLCGEADPMRGHIYKNSVEKLPLRTGLTMVSSAVCAVAEPVFLIIRGSSDNLGFGFLFIVIEVCVFCLEFLIMRNTKEDNWEIIYKDT